MNSDISTSRGRRLVLAATVLVVLALAAWALVATGDSHRSTADAADRASPTAVSSPATPDHPPTPQPADPPTTMPDGSPIPAPSPGTPDAVGEGRTQAVTPVSVSPPVGLDETADFGTGLTVGLTGIEPVEGVARAPGEIAGPALEVTVEAVNDSAEPISLDGVIVFLSYGEDRVPATDFGQGSAPLAGALAAGSSTTGTYLLAVPEDQRDDVRVEVSYTGEAPTVAFTGSLD